MPVRSALNFIVLLGLVSLFADVTYEGARSITGPFLLTLGASATVVGAVAGFGELMGHGLRIVSGYVADRTGKYWTLTILGYGLNLLAVPLLALAGRWEVAAALIILERTGKAIRAPARDAMLSHATHPLGRGKGFGLHEAMDQIGALSGPLLVAAVLYFKGGHRSAFALLLAPALMALSALLLAKRLYPEPRALEASQSEHAKRGFPRAYWIYLSGVGLLAAGFADFPLIAYHFKSAGIASDTWIPLTYAFAMGVDGLAALLCGYLYDRAGVRVLALAACVSAVAPPLIFWGGSSHTFLGVILWGAGLGAQESVMRAAVADLVPPDRRGSAYGIFNAGYGLFWFLGSTLMGALYGRQRTLMVMFSTGVQILSIPLLLLSQRRRGASHSRTTR